MLCDKWIYVSFVIWTDINSPRSSPRVSERAVIFIFCFWQIWISFSFSLSLDVTSRNSRAFWVITFPIPREHEHHDLVEERSSPLPHDFLANTSVCLTWESHAAALPRPRHFWQVIYTQLIRVTAVFSESRNQFYQVTALMTEACNRGLRHGQLYGFP